ncbi:MAG: hypothetical protein HY660_09350, partial [Armatimonadetes bacterium]|nr:hypothetical protein [Armatimonadota bacterium]
MKGHRLVVLAVALAVLLNVSLIEVQTQTDPKTFVLGQVGFALTLPINPIIRRANPRATFWMFDSLVGYTQDMRPAGQLAERWEISPDGKTYTFYLRRNVKWHDGHPFTADDVVFTAETALDRKNASPSRRSYLIRGEPVKVEKIDAYTVRFHLPQPSFLFLFNMAGWNLIVPKHLLQGKDLQTAEFNSRPIGTGPFKFVEFRERQYIRMAANPDYFRGRPKLDGWITREIGDQSSALAALAKGEIDFMRVDNREGLETAKRFSGVKIYSYDAGWIFAFNMNHKASFFGDTRVRQALAYAFDRAQLVKTVVADLPVAWSLIGPPTSWAHNANVPRYPKDVAKARALLSEAGLRPADGVLQKDGKPFKFTVIIQSPTADDPESFAVALREAWKAIGVE